MVYMLPDFFPKSKDGWLALFDRLTVPLIVMLAALLSFGIGRLSALEEGRGQVIIHPPSQAASASFAAARNSSAIAVPDPWLSEEEAPSRNPHASGNPDGPRIFVASKNGTKYYPVDCGGAKRIGDKNKIWFPTEEAARLAGYSRAANCKF